MRFDVIIKQEFGNTNVTGIIYLYTGNILHNEEIGVDYEESIHVAFEWPKDADEMAETLDASLNELLHYYLKNKENK